MRVPFTKRDISLLRRLRTTGWTIRRLQKHFHITSETIYLYVPKDLNRKKPEEPVIHIPMDTSKYAHILNEPVNQGKSYREYLKSTGAD